MIKMTMHTIRGSTGLVKNVYEWSVNVSTSSDMGIFMATGSGSFEVAKELADKKLKECFSAQTLYYAKLLSLQYEDILAWGWLWDCWFHFIEFHSGSTGQMISQMNYPKPKEPDCKWFDDYIEPIFYK